MAGAANTTTGSGSTRRRPRRPSNTSSGVGDTNPPRKRPSSSSGGSSGSGGGGGFAWKGRGGHSISFAAHLRNLAAKKADRDPLYQPATQLSGKSLADAAGALTDLEFNPQEQALRQSLQDTTTQGTALAQRAGDYWSQLGGIDAAIPGQQQAITDALKTSIGENATAASAGIQSGIDDATKRAQADEAIRGIGSAATGASTEGAAQLGRVAEQRQAAGDSAASQGAGWQQLANLAATARRQQGGEVQRDLLTRLANTQLGVREKQTQLSADRGAATTKNLTDLRQQAFENLMTQGGLNIKAEDIASTERTAAAKVKSSAKQAGLDRASREKIARDNRAARAQADKAARAGKANGMNSVVPTYTNAQWLKMTTAERQQAISDYNKQKTKDTTRPKATGGTGQPTATAQAMVTQIENGVSDTGTDEVLKRHVNESGPRLTQILVKRGMPPLQAQATAEIARHRYLTPETAAALGRAGIKVPPDWLNPYAGLTKPG